MDAAATGPGPAPHKGGRSRCGLSRRRSADPFRLKISPASDEAEAAPVAYRGAQAPAGAAELSFPHLCLMARHNRAPELETGRAHAPRDGTLAIGGTIAKTAGECSVGVLALDDESTRVLSPTATPTPGATHIYLRLGEQRSKNSRQDQRPNHDCCAHRNSILSRRVRRKIPSAPT